MSGSNTNEDEQTTQTEDPEDGSEDSSTEFDDEEILKLEQSSFVFTEEDALKDGEDDDESESDESDSEQDDDEFAYSDDDYVFTERDIPEEDDDEDGIENLRIDRINEDGLDAPKEDGENLDEVPDVPDGEDTSVGDEDPEFQVDDGLSEDDEDFDQNNEHLEETTHVPLPVVEQPEFHSLADDGYWEEDDEDGEEDPDLDDEGIEDDASEINILPEPDVIPEVDDEDPEDVVFSLSLLGEDDVPYANKKFCIEVDGTMSDPGKTDGEGNIEVEVPSNSTSARVIMWPEEDDEEYTLEWALQFQPLEPINTEAGVCARLNNLGYVASDPQDLDSELLGDAVFKFQSDQGLTATGDIDDPTMAAILKEHGN